MVNKVAYAVLGVVLSAGVAVLAFFSLVVGTAIGVALAGTPYLLMTI